jgi:hypothetical protein
MRKLFSTVLLTLTIAGCGTGVYNNKIEVTINDPSKRLGAEPIEVSVFHKNSGSSEEWARKTIGSTGAGKAYSAEVSETDMKMFYDRTPPSSIGVGVFLPAFEKDGYFVLEVRPVAGAEQTTLMNYRSFYVPTAEEDKIQPLAARLTSKGNSKGWTIRMIVDVPPGESKKP